MAEDNEVFIEDDAVVLEDTDDTDVVDAETSKIIPFIMEKYNRAEDYRRQDETRWLRAYRNYRGIYGPEVQFTEAEKSRVFIKVTKTKTLAAYGQIADVLFAKNAFPISIDPTQLPEGIVEDVSFDPALPDPLREDEKSEPVSPYGFSGDGKEFPAGATSKTLQELLNPELDKKLESIKGVKEGATRLAAYLRRHELHAGWSTGRGKAIHSRGPC